MKMKAYEKIVSKALSKAKYRHANKCKSEVLNAMKIYRGLSPKFEKFIFDNGEEKDLLNLVGTIPVDYKGHTYNIPIQVKNINFQYGKYSKTFFFREIDLFYLRIFWSELSVVVAV